LPRILFCLRHQKKATLIDIITTMIPIIIPAIAPPLRLFAGALPPGFAVPLDSGFNVPMVTDAVFEAPVVGEDTVLLEVLVVD